MSRYLYDLIRIKRRYSRSVNLERDIEIADSVKGYILSPHIAAIASRFFTSFTEPQSVRAWTLTGVYGTGKSAFAHFLLALCSSSKSPIRRNAERILKGNKGQQVNLKGIIPDRGIIRAVATAQREPILSTLIRALKMGSESYWAGMRGVRPKALEKILSLEHHIKKNQQIDNREVIQLIQELSAASKAGLIIVIDELGKNLEYVSQNQANNDLYLLQQLAEIPSRSNAPKVFFIGLLHQAFSDYAHSLTMAQKNEWSKIQGRFEDIPFSESSERMLHLIGNAIEHYEPQKNFPDLSARANAWQSALSKYSIMKGISTDDIASVYPFHPLSAYVLPILCNKYSQNDRTLFTFLSSNEPHSFASFLKETAYEIDSARSLKLYHLYDYFIESAGITTTSLPQFQRWVEIQSRISDAKGFSSDEISVLKSIGILNLVASTGLLRASRSIVALSLCNDPSDTREKKRYDAIIESLIKKGFITWRKQIDELRIWEGTDFDIESVMSEQLQQVRLPLAEILNEYYPSMPVIANRHSYVTGTLRYFEKMYVDGSNEKDLAVVSKQYDGRICYWVDTHKKPDSLQTYSADGKPIVAIMGCDLESLAAACHEFVALSMIDKSAVQLQTDGVARKEVRQRKFLARRVLEDALANSFDLGRETECSIDDALVKVTSDKMLNSQLSDLCDRTYAKGLHLWNELLNKRDLTSQAVKARRELIEAMLKNMGQENLGIKGYGPEFCMFQSLLKETGIYAYKDDAWTICQPQKEAGVYEAWKKIEEFCLSAVESPQKISILYEELERPPFGIRQGAIPILLLSVFLHHEDYLSIYYDGTYLPILGAEHFELLMRQPQKFAVKYLRMVGLRAEIFKELESFIYDPLTNKKMNVRNATLLAIVNPLIKFVRNLPQCSLKTALISTEAQLVRKSILEAREPDTLLFVSLPQALGMNFLDGLASADSSMAKGFTKKLRDAFQEIGQYYPNLLEYCKKLLHQVFSIRSDVQSIREDLRVRAEYLRGQVIEPLMKRFVLAATDKDADETKWLEALIMIIADKPAESWADEDRVVLEARLVDLARRFKNLEAIQKQAESTQREGFDACKITVTRPSGDEISEIVWLDHSKKDEIKKIAHDILSEEIIQSNDKIKKGIIAAMIEEVFASNGVNESKSETKDLRTRKQRA